MGKLAVYRAERCVESVLIKSRAGRTLARFYDKGAQAGHAPRGRWLRFEAQWRFAREARPSLAELDQALLRERFARRFAPLWQAAGGFALGGLEAVGARVDEAVRSGQLLPSRARSLVGYLVLRSTGVPQGASRTVNELERECRQLGLSVSLLNRQRAASMSPPSSTNASRRASGAENRTPPETDVRENRHQFCRCAAISLRLGSTKTYFTRRGIEPNRFSVSG